MLIKYSHHLFFYIFLFHNWRRIPYSLDINYLIPPTSITSTSGTLCIVCIVNSVSGTNRCFSFQISHWRETEIRSRPSRPSLRQTPESARAQIRPGQTTKPWSLILNSYYMQNIQFLVSLPLTFFELTCLQQPNPPTTPNLEITHNLCSNINPISIKSQLSAHNRWRLFGPHTWVLMQ